jgi:hypothetical protein
MTDGGPLRYDIVLRVGAAVLAVGLSVPTLAATQTQEPPPVPLRLSAWAVNMSNIATGSNAVLDINITRWSTAKEREQLITTFLEKGSEALLRALQRTPSHGRMRIPGWVGPDPHNVRLGWDLHYAWHLPGEDGGQRIVLGTDRYISFWEARNQPRTVDYPFTLMEIRLNKNGEGEGKLAVATKISFNKKKNAIELENYSSEPVRLQQVKIEK